MTLRSIASPATPAQPTHSSISVSLLMPNSRPEVGKKPQGHFSFPAVLRHRHHAHTCSLLGKLPPTWRSMRGRKWRVVRCAGRHKRRADLPPFIPRPSEELDFDFRFPGSCGKAQGGHGGQGKKARGVGAGNFDFTCNVALCQEDFDTKHRHAKKESVSKCTRLNN